MPDFLNAGGNSAGLSHPMQRQKNAAEIRKLWKALQSPAKIPPYVQPLGPVLFHQVVAQWDNASDSFSYEEGWDWESLFSYEGKVVWWQTGYPMSNPAMNTRVVVYDFTVWPPELLIDHEFVQDVGAEAYPRSSRRIDSQGRMWFWFNESVGPTTSSAYIWSLELTEGSVPVRHTVDWTGFAPESQTINPGLWSPGWAGGDKLLAVIYTNPSGDEYWLVIDVSGSSPTVVGSYGMNDLPDGEGSNPFNGEEETQSWSMWDETGVGLGYRSTVLRTVAPTLYYDDAVVDDVEIGLRIYDHDLNLIDRMVVATVDRPGENGAGFNWGAYGGSYVSDDSDYALLTWSDHQYRRYSLTRTWVIDLTTMEVVDGWAEEEFGAGYLGIVGNFGTLGNLITLYPDIYGKDSEFVWSDGVTSYNKFHHVWVYSIDEQKHYRVFIDYRIANNRIEATDGYVYEWYEVAHAGTYWFATGAIEYNNSNDYLTGLWRLDLAELPWVEIDAPAATRNDLCDRIRLLRPVYYWMLADDGQYGGANGNLGYSTTTPTVFQMITLAGTTAAAYAGGYPPETTGVIGNLNKFRGFTVSSLGYARVVLAYAQMAVPLSLFLMVRPTRASRTIKERLAYHTERFNFSINDGVAGRVKLEIYNSAGAVITTLQATVSSIANANTWHALAFTIRDNDDGATIWHNGSVIADVGSGSAGMSTDSVGEFQIGAGTGSGETFVGGLGHVAIFRHELSQSDVDEIMESVYHENWPL